MIIVSQDNKKIFNFNNTSLIFIQHENEIWIDTEKTCNLLGKYATEQRAREVLAEIYKKYSDWQSMRMIKNEEIQAKIVSGDNSKYFDVYMTPEE